MKYLPILGVIIGIGSFLLVTSKLKDLNIERKGVVVKMKIEKLPEFCFGSKSRYVVVLSYGDKTYEKRVRGGFCRRHRVGEFIEMKMLNNSSKILFANESVTLEITCGIVLGLFGFGIAISQWKKGRTKRR